jgi:hypothetical protein
VGKPNSNLGKITTHLTTLKKTGSELKLKDFQEKSGPPKSSILAPRLALQAEQAGDCTHTSSLWYHFIKPTYKNKLTQKAIPTRIAWAQTP